ncbi:MAG: ankyrin repeat domain-containing protein, partial [Pseudomonadota bacterium]|nr:ankyrin repeat domain-containing protein [Pseudomonadota bacterium]
MQEPIIKSVFEKHLSSGDIARIKEYIHLHPAIHEENNASILHAAVKSGNAEIVLLVLNRTKVDVNAFFKEKTALHLAVKMDSVESVLVLLYAGADVNLTDKHGYSALHYALSYQCDEIIDLLLTGKLPKERHLAIQENRCFDSISAHFSKGKTWLLNTNVDLQSKAGVT